MKTCLVIIGLLSLVGFLTCTPNAENMDRAARHSERLGMILSAGADDRGIAGRGSIHEDEISLAIAQSLCRDKKVDFFQHRRLFP